MLICHLLYEWASQAYKSSYFKFWLEDDKFFQAVGKAENREENSSEHII